MPIQHRVLIVTSDGENEWSARLDGVEVVSFVGPHAQEWAFRERGELAQLLDAHSYGDWHYERRDAAYPSPSTQ